MKIMFEELDLSFSLEDNNKGISELNLGKYGGPDKIINEFIYYGKDIFGTILHSLFNKLLQIGYFPNSWSKGYIVPIHKKRITK